MSPPPPPVVPPAVVGAAAAGTGYAALTWLLQREVSEPPRLVCGDGPLKRDVVPRCPALLRPFTPTPWALNTHLQTLLGLLRKASIGNQYSRQLVVCGDGGTVGLDWFRNCCAPAYAPTLTPIVLVMHGVNGGSHEGYCKWACATAVARGWRAVVLNYRGCNGLSLTSARGYTASLTNDVHLAIASINGRFPGAPVCAVAYSLGSILLAKYMAEADSHAEGPGSGLASAALVSSPVCLTTSMANLSRPWTLGFVYNLAVAHKLREFISEHLDVIRHDRIMDMDAALRAWTVQEVEDSGLMEAYGYDSRQDYYNTVSSLEHLPGIRTPTLVLVSQDDPFLGTVPEAECGNNPFTLLAVTRRGGHIGFTQGLWPFSGPAYMDEAVMEFFGAVMEQPSSTWRDASSSGSPEAFSIAACTADAGGGGTAGGTTGGTGRSLLLGAGGRQSEPMEDWLRMQEAGVGGASAPPVGLRSLLEAQRRERVGREAGHAAWGAGLVSKL